MPTETSWLIKVPQWFKTTTKTNVKGMAFPQITNWEAKWEFSNLWMRLLTHVNFGYGYWHMQLTGIKHIRNFLNWGNCFVKKNFFWKTTQAQTKKPFNYSKFKTLGLSTPMSSNSQERFAPSKDRLFPQSSHFIGDQGWLRKKDSREVLGEQWPTVTKNSGWGSSSQTTESRSSKGISPSSSAGCFHKICLWWF